MWGFKMSIVEEFSGIDVDDMLQYKEETVFLTHFWERERERGGGGGGGDRQTDRERDRGLSVKVVKLLFLFVFCFEYFKCLWLECDTSQMGTEILPGTTIDQTVRCTLIKLNCIFSNKIVINSYTYSVVISEFKTLHNRSMLHTSFYVLSFHKTFYATHQVNTQLWVKTSNFIHKVPKIKRLNNYWAHINCIQSRALCTGLGGTTLTDVDICTYVSTHVI